MFHTIIIVGNLGKDPEMRYTPSGQAVTSFSVATSRKYTSSNGEQVNETIWFRVSAWGKQAEVCNQYLKKGSKVLVEGDSRQIKILGGLASGRNKTDHPALHLKLQPERFVSCPHAATAILAPVPRLMQGIWLWLLLKMIFHSKL